MSGGNKCIGNRYQFAVDGEFPLVYVEILYPTNFFFFYAYEKIHSSNSRSGHTLGLSCDSGRK